MFRNLMPLFVFAVITSALFGTAGPSQADDQPLTNQQQVDRYHQLSEKLTVQVNELKKLESDATVSKLLSGFEARVAGARALEGKYKQALDNKSGQPELEKLAAQYALLMADISTTGKELSDHLSKIGKAIAKTLVELESITLYHASDLKNVIDQSDYVDRSQQTFKDGLNTFAQFRLAGKLLMLEREQQGQPVDLNDSAQVQQISTLAAMAVLESKALGK